MKRCDPLPYVGITRIRFQESGKFFLLSFCKLPQLNCTVYLCRVTSGLSIDLSILFGPGCCLLNPLIISFVIIVRNSNGLLRTGGLKRAPMSGELSIGFKRHLLDFPESS